MAIQIVLRTRRFFCDQSAYPQRIFTERLPSVVAPRSSRTHHLATTHQHITLVAGGNGGTRLTTKLGIPIGRDRLITDIRA